MMMEVEKFFHTEVDTTQIPATLEGFRRIEKLHPSAVKCFMDGDDIVSVALTIPTTKELAKKFIAGDITERELLERSEPKERYEALYFHLAFTLRAYRGRKLTEKMFEEAVREIPCEKDAMYFAWSFSDGGNKVLDALENDLGIIIHRKPHN